MIFQVALLFRYKGAVLTIKPFITMDSRVMVAEVVFGCEVDTA